MAFPRPAKIKVFAEFGRDMTTLAMREAAAKINEEYGSYYHQVDRILTVEQKERLRQLGNQILMYRGWQEVPLTCPEWREYLDLSRQQLADFHHVQEKFRHRLEQLEWEMREHERSISLELEEKIGEILNDRQEGVLLELFSHRVN